MQKKYPIIAGLVILTILSVVVITEPYTYNALMTIAGAATPYIQADMSKSNPNIRQGVGTASMSTNNISDVKDDVSNTIRGKVIAIGEPVPWVDNAGNDRGAIPVEIQVDEVYKGTGERSEIFTVYVRSIKADDIYHILVFEASYEVGEEVIVHLSRVSPDAPYIGTDSEKSYLTTLGAIGKYTVHDDRAYNEKFPHGVPIYFAANEAK